MPLLGGRTSSSVEGYDRFRNLCFDACEDKGQEWDKRKAARGLMARGFDLARNGMVFRPRGWAVLGLFCVPTRCRLDEVGVAPLLAAQAAFKRDMASKGGPARRAESLVCGRKAGG